MLWVRSNHFLRGAARESQHEDARRIDAVQHQVRGSMRQGVGLARTRAGQNEQRTRITLPCPEPPCRTWRRGAAPGFSASNAVCLGFHHTGDAVLYVYPDIRCNASKLPGASRICRPAREETDHTVARVSAMIPLPLASEAIHAETSGRRQQPGASTAASSKSPPSACATRTAANTTSTSSAIPVPRRWSRSTARIASAWCASIGTASRIFCGRFPPASSMPASRLQDCAVRELTEETGVSAKRWTSLGHLHSGARHIHRGDPPLSGARS